MLILIIFIVLLILLIIIIVLLLVGGGVGVAIGGKRKKHDPLIEEVLILGEDLEYTEWKFREIPLSELKLSKMLGQGAYGKVYAGKWRNLAVAEKVCPSEPELLEEWRKELGIMTRLGNHPNVLPLFGACTQSPDAFYLVTKFCDLGSVLDYWVHLHGSSSLST